MFLKGTLLIFNTGTILREMQIKSSMSYWYTLLEWLKKKKVLTPNAGGRCRETKLSHTAGENIKGYSCCGEYLVIPLETKNGCAIQPTQQLHS